ncbi:S1C family serine protease [Pseudonocardia sp.]|uniref:S1C family serine protease n=1 Tax=Pseudonocardia sp. TaxID=60912 RepID=UPI003D09BB8F
MSDDAPGPVPGTDETGTAAAGVPPRLAPRPLERPAVDPDAEAAFGRPAGTDGGFQPAAFRAAPAPAGPPPPTALAYAFGRPDGVSVPLQRPPSNGTRTARPDDEPLWADGSDGAATADPWRDPASHAGLAPPVPEQASAPPDASEGARLSTRELLFGRRVQPRALVTLGLIALLIGAAGGVVGRVTAEGAAALTEPDATITQATEAKERPPGSVADIAARTVPAVVSLELRVGDEGGTGSGVVIDPAGYVLTNNHVVAPVAEVPDAQLEAIFHDGTRAKATIVGRDPKTDLAVVKVAVANPVVAQIGSSSSLAVGDAVLAIGSPLGLVGTVTTGIVSALDRPVPLDGGETDTNAVIDAIQTDAAINPGNSGGPLVDSTGAVVGINTAIRSIGGGGGEGGSIGLGFAIPIDDARRIAEELIRAGSVKHAELGVNARSVADDTTDGAQVQNVRQGGAAAAAGIVEGDVITRVGDRQIAGADELIVAVRERRPGESVPIDLIRDGRPLTITVVLGSD